MLGMSNILKDKIEELESKKEGLRKEFSEYDTEWIDNYIELAKIDGAIKVLKDMIIEEITKM